MRSYPDSDYEKKDLESLNPEDWQIQLLKINPDYPFWGNYEDYMISSNKSNWRSPIEIESFKEFDITLDCYNECANFYFEVYRKNHECKNCEGISYNPKTKELYDTWYDFRNTGKKWCYNISQIEVDALWEKNRLKPYFKEKPTPEEVNNWSKKGIGHDGINMLICVEARAKHLGVFGYCDKCNGKGYIYDEDFCRVGLQLWILHPRKGASRGCYIKNINQEDLPKVYEFLKVAKERNEDKFKNINMLINNKMKENN